MDLPSNLSFPTPPPLCYTAHWAECHTVHQTIVRDTAQDNLEHPPAQPRQIRMGSISQRAETRHLTVSINVEGENRLMIS
jgi:hypothetical protein